MFSDKMSWLIQFHPAKAWDVLTALRGADVDNLEYTNELKANTTGFVRRWALMEGDSHYTHCGGAILNSPIQGLSDKALLTAEHLVLEQRRVLGWHAASHLQKALDAIAFANKHAPYCRDGC